MAHILSRSPIWRPAASLRKVAFAQFSTKPSAWYPFLAWSAEKIMEQITSADTPIKKSFDLFEVARSRKLADTYAYNALMSRLFEANFTDDGLKLLQLMRTDGLLPNVRTYHVLIKGLCQQARVVEAREFLSVMASEGVSPDSTIYTALVSAYLRMKDLASVDEIIQLCGKENFQLDMYTTLIHGYLKIGLLDKAMHAFSDMTAAGFKPTEVTYGAIIDGYVENGNMDNVWEVVDRVRESGETLNYEQLYSTIIAGFVRVRNFKRAEQLLVEMSGFAKPSVAAFGSLLDGYLKANDEKSAQRIMDLMSANGITKDIIAYNSMLARYCDNGMMVEASKLMEEVITQGLMPDRIMFDCLIRGFAAQKDLYSAWQAFMLMLDMHITPDARNFATIISCFWMEGYRDMEECEKIFDMMNLQKVKPTGSVYTYMIAGFLNEDNFLEASRYADMMHDAKVSPDADAVAVVIDYFGFRRNTVVMDRFIKFAKERSLTNTEVDVYNLLLQQQGYQSGYTEAVKVYFEIKKLNIAPTARTFTSLVRVAKSKTECSEVFKEISAMKVLADEILMRAISKAQKLFDFSDKELPVLLR